MRFGHVIISIFCAWVLWGTPFDKTTGANAGAAVAMNGFDKRSECVKEVRSLGEGTAARRMNDKFTWNHACLPDTIDPREPRAPTGGK